MWKCDMCFAFNARSRTKSWRQHKVHMHNIMAYQNDKSETYMHAQTQVAIHFTENGRIFWTLPPRKYVPPWSRMRSIVYYEQNNLQYAHPFYFSRSIRWIFTSFYILGDILLSIHNIHEWWIFPSHSASTYSHSLTHSFQHWRISHDKRYGNHFNGIYRKRKCKSVFVQY